MQNSDIASRNRALKTELKRVVNELKKAGVERIILFGSLARDDIGLASDIDLLVVQETKKGSWSSLSNFMRSLILDMPLIFLFILHRNSMR